MVSDTLEQRIYELVRSHDGIYLFKKKELTPSTDLDSDLQLEDDEVLALMDDFFTTFNVDKGNKNWRARQGLSTPMIEHPLMNSPMTTANCPDFSQWQRPEWFNPLVDFLAQRRPELAFLRHLFI
ncbi:TPA: DUF1493 family protein [Salmonella enterica]|uniref:DUF1493 family protein n=1 Tax=Salmonella enterica TaxID=28901 RepID=A0A760N968_SALER|nr:DUF1493 family protein [Salmonella enterica]